MFVQHEHTHTHTPNAQTFGSHVVTIYGLRCSGRRRPPPAGRRTYGRVASSTTNDISRPCYTDIGRRNCFFLRRPMGHSMHFDTSESLCLLCTILPQDLMAAANPTGHLLGRGFFIGRLLVANLERLRAFQQPLFPQCPWQFYSPHDLL